MPITYYETVNGEILGEQTGGVYTGYLRDALGSVTGTTDASGNLQNTYRWAGYGTQISKTGTAADPKFLWNGGWGYRQTGRAHAGVYVRRRHYDWRQAAWNSLDPLWLRRSPYAYAARNPTRMADPSGLDPISAYGVGLDTATTGNWYLTTCGQYNTRTKFEDVPNQDGWLIQRIDKTWHTEGCSPFSAPSYWTESYYEAWEVYSTSNSDEPNLADCVGKVYYFDDQWSTNNRFLCHATQTVTGQVMYQKGGDLPSGFVCRNPLVNADNALWTARISDWSGFKGGAIIQSLTMTTDCCSCPTPAAVQFSRDPNFATDAPVNDCYEF